MEDKIRRYAEEIALIIAVTEEVKDSYESEYTKKQAMLHAYEDIVELVGGEALEVAIDTLTEKPLGIWRVDVDDNRRWDRIRYYCSECGEWQTYGELTFCPNCGHKMEVRPSKWSNIGGE